MSETTEGRVQTRRNNMAEDWRDVIGVSPAEVPGLNAQHGWSKFRVIAGPRGTGVVSIPLADTPERCGNCGYVGAQWPFGVFGGRLNVTCPQCHVIVAEVVAVPQD